MGSDPAGLGLAGPRGDGQYTGPAGQGGGYGDLATDSTDPGGRLYPAGPGGTTYGAGPGSGFGGLSADSTDPGGRLYPAELAGPPYATPLGGPSYGADPNRPSYGADLNGPSYGADPSAPSYGADPNGPSYSAALGGPPFSAELAGPPYSLDYSGPPYGAPDQPVAGTGGSAQPADAPYGTGRYRAGDGPGTDPAGPTYPSGTYGTGQYDLNTGRYDAPPVNGAGRDAPPVNSPRDASPVNGIGRYDLGTGRYDAPGVNDAEAGDPARGNGQYGAGPLPTVAGPLPTVAGPLPTGAGSYSTGEPTYGEGAGYDDGKYGGVRYGTARSEPERPGDDRLGAGRQPGAGLSSTPQTGTGQSSGAQPGSAYFGEARTTDDRIAPDQTGPAHLTPGTTTPGSLSGGQAGAGIGGLGSLGGVQAGGTQPGTALSGSGQSGGAQAGTAQAGASGYGSEQSDTGKYGLEQSAAVGYGVENAAVGVERSSTGGYADERGGAGGGGYGSEQGGAGGYGVERGGAGGSGSGEGRVGGSSYGGSDSGGIGGDLPTTRVTVAHGDVAGLAVQFQQRFHALAGNIEQVIRGKRETIELALVCLFSEGHLLIEDVPGTGKTTLARSLAASIQAELRRIQFTPDLIPSDITGVSIYSQAHQRFEFHPGPVFANLVLADEINRASPKTQAALLEVMEERRVTVDAESHPVPRPFMVLATQNPVDMDGTYPLPEAQLDRFLMCVSVGYPDHASEVEVLKGMPAGPKVEHLPLIARAADVAGMIDFVTRIHVADSIYDYVVALVSATRRSPEVRLGASPRASLALLRASRVMAAAAGRHYVIPEDVRALVAPVLAHRLILTPEAEMRDRTATSVIESTLAATPGPQALAAV
ncbi:AAA family ATPase [Sphaerisporangium corydalis]|uniref:AAA family ATPase n=1 Tax=Sphaerisporangium corydalis TaxID=1441875 RepID=UPI0021D1CCD1|nr:AAA family ATPase [Sphaerisporangium corydalis]